MSATAMEPFTTWYDGKLDTKKTENWYFAKDAVETRVSEDVRELLEEDNLHRVCVESADGTIEVFEVEIEIEVTARKAD